MKNCSASENRTCVVSCPSRAPRLSPCFHGLTGTTRLRRRSHDHTATRARQHSGATGEHGISRGSRRRYQNYICLPQALGSNSPLTPQATLFNNADKEVITHYFSPNPVEGGTIRVTWQHSRDASTVWGKVQGPSPRPAGDSSSDPISSHRVPLPGSK